MEKKGEGAERGERERKGRRRSFRTTTCFLTYTEIWLSIYREGGRDPVTFCALQRKEQKAKQMEEKPFLAGCTTAQASLHSEKEKRRTHKQGKSMGNRVKPHFGSRKKDSILRFGTFRPRLRPSWANARKGLRSKSNVSLFLVGQHQAVLMPLLC